MILGQKKPPLDDLARPAQVLLRVARLMSPSRRRRPFERYLNKTWDDR
jgi:hypothetical protein